MDERSAFIDAEVQWVMAVGPEHSRTGGKSERLANAPLLMRGELTKISQYVSCGTESRLDPIISEALDGILSSWNPALERYFGFSAQEARQRAEAAVLQCNERFRHILEKA